MAATRAWLGIGTAALLIATLSVAPTYHFVWKHELETQLLWSQSEAFVAIQTRHAGWHGSIFGVLWQVFRNVAGGITATTHAVESLEMIRFDRGGLHRTAARNVRVTRFVPVEGHLITNANGRIARWTGSGFEPVSGDVAAYFKSAAVPLGDYDNVGGWSNRARLLSWGRGNTRQRITVSGRQLEVRVKAPSDFSAKELSLAIDDASPQVILAIRSGRTNVDAAEYESLFQMQ